MFVRIDDPILPRAEHYVHKMTRVKKKSEDMDHAGVRFSATGNAATAAKTTLLFPICMVDIKNKMRG